MRRSWLVSICVITLLAGAAGATEQALQVSPFGTVQVYSESAQPGRVALFVSGDGGWNQGVVDMARELAHRDVLVVGVDIVAYERSLADASGPCGYPAADFEHLSQSVQQQLGRPKYTKPILVGYSSGATLVYAVLVQAPSTTFKGGVSLGFCPDLPLAKPLCKGNGLEWQPGPKGKGYSFLPAPHLAVPWIALQGTIDQVCDPQQTQSYVKRVGNAEVVMLPKVGHGYSVPKNWLSQFVAAFERVAAAPDASEPPAAAEESLSDLPLVEVAAQPGASDSAMALELTGDGGYGVTDKGISEGLAAQGVPVVVLNSLHYFWNAKTPEQTASDVTRVLRHYLQAWGKKQILFIGYSHGADVTPFIVDGLPADLRARIRTVALLGIGSEADFKFHFGDLLSSHHRDSAIPVLPALEKLRGLSILCFYGTEDKSTICPSLDSTLARAVPLESGHRFGTNYQPIVTAILRGTP